MSEKKLIDYTLADVKKACGEMVKHGCIGCPFVDDDDKNKDDGSCSFFHRNPCDWTFPTVTKAERELLRLTGAKFVSRDDGIFPFVALWKGLPTKRDNGTYVDAGLIGRLEVELLPSVKRGACLDVSDLLDEGAQTDG